MKQLNVKVMILLFTLSMALFTSDIESKNKVLDNPRKLLEFADMLIQNQETVLVVGHSNTTDKLASLLSGQSVSQIDESEYDNLFIVSRFGKQASLQIIQQSFVCDDK